MTQRDGAYRLEGLYGVAVGNLPLRRLALYGHAAGRESSACAWNIQPWLRRNRTKQKIHRNNQETLFASLLGKSAFLDDRSRNSQIVHDIIPLVFGRLGQRAEERTTRPLETVLFESYRFSVCLYLPWFPRLAMRWWRKWGSCGSLLKREWFWYDANWTQVSRGWSRL
jgi:hypothetical protein